MLKFKITYMTYNGIKIFNVEVMQYQDWNISILTNGLVSDWSQVISIVQIPN